MFCSLYSKRASFCEVWLPSAPQHPGHIECPILLRTDLFLGGRTHTFSWPQPQAHQAKETYTGAETLISVNKNFSPFKRARLRAQFRPPRAPLGSLLFKQVRPPSLPKSGHPTSHAGQEAICPFLLGQALSWHLSFPTPNRLHTPAHCSLSRLYRPAKLQVHFLIPEVFHPGFPGLLFY